MEDNERFREFIAGYVSGEGSFFVTLGRNKGRKSLRVVCGFSIKVRKDDRPLLRNIWQELGFPGNLYDIPSYRYRYEHDKVQRHDAALLLVRALNDLIRYIIPFFDQHSLRGRKAENYELWKQVVNLVRSGEAHSSEGFQHVLEIQSQLN